ncbi:MAG: VWA domain-containing protein [Rhodoblastus sp.]|nr:VWA domain-containing protein [Rhodoblastus sp.]
MLRHAKFIGLLSSTARFCGDRRGSVSIVFAVAAVPALALVGASIDYTRGTGMVVQAQAAADAAVLAAGAQAGATQAARQTVASNIASAYFGAAASKLSLVITESDNANDASIPPGYYQVTITGAMPTIAAKLVGKSTMKFSVVARATSNGVSNTKPLEMALALDNTGSMSGNMADLKAAAKTLVDTVMGSGGGAARVSVVPYVAVVNPGLTDATSVTNYIDTKMANPFNGVWQRGAWLTYTKNCSLYWGPPSGGGGGGGGGGGAGSGGTGDARDIIDILKPIRHLAMELFGVSSAHAADVTPNTISPLTTKTWTSPQSGKTYTYPTGFQTVGKDIWGAYSTGGCDWLANPDTVSHYELFNRIKNPAGGTTTWKGCVEARLSKSEQQWVNSNWGWGLTASKDYDISEDAPTTSDTASLYVPYFAPDEPDYSPYTWAYVAPGAYSSANQGFHNNYLKDGGYLSTSDQGSIPSTWNWTQLGQYDWGGGQYILKYDGKTNAAIIQETPDANGYTYGPNMGCPDPILRLTNDKATVTAKIDGLKYWQSGGTIISEGLAWAWRTLSPNKPFADGKAYATTGLQKVIVLMTDGVNELIDNANNASGYNSAHVSDYSAYGYLGGARVWNANNIQTYAGFQTLMDNRLTAACTAAKNAGVIIYTVVFNHTGYLTSSQQSAAQNLLKNCASKTTYSYVATDSATLQSAFAAIAVSATSGTLRLVQ